jgi:hypothetical protein
MRQVGSYLVLGSLGLASIGCAGPIAAVDRASREFSCPPERIAAVERNDIASNVYDLNVCGAMIRYSCTWGGHAPVQCTREPAPAKWDIDPTLVAALPRPLSVPADFGTPAVCDSRTPVDRCRPCLERDGPGWRWHECVDGPGPTGVGF